MKKAVLILGLVFSFVLCIFAAQTSIHHNYGAIHQENKSLENKGSRAFWKRISSPSLRDVLGLQRLPHCFTTKNYEMQTRKKKIQKGTHPEMGNPEHLINTIKKLELFEALDEFNMWDSRRLTQHLFAAMKLYAKAGGADVDNAFETTQKVMAVITAINQSRDLIFEAKVDLNDEVKELSQW